MHVQDKYELTSGIRVPEIKSCVAQTVEGLTGDSSKEHRLTLLALLSFYRKNLNNTMSIETEGNRLKSRLMETGVLYFGPCFNGQAAVSRAKRLSQLADAGFSVQHLVFLNPTQVELFFAYVCETGLVHD